MKKLIYISFIFSFILAFASCEKEDLSADRFQDDSIWDCDMNTNGQKGHEINSTGTGVTTGGGVKDPDDDEDYDQNEKGGKGGIVDPDDDEDYDKNEPGIVDPDDDEDYDEDEGK